MPREVMLDCGDCIALLRENLGDRLCLPRPRLDADGAARRERRADAERQCMYAVRPSAPPSSAAMGS